MNDTPLATSKAPAKSKAWIMPVLAVIVVVTLYVMQTQAKGPDIHINFSHGHGLKEGDSLKHRGVDIGTVTEIHLNESLDKVEVTVNLLPSATPLAKEGSVFWVVRPSFSLREVSGLDTLIGSRYIKVSPGTGAPTYQFEGLNNPPEADEDLAPGIRFNIVTLSRGSIQPGALVTYRDMAVGKILAVNLAQDARFVELKAWVADPYSELVRDNSVFWRAERFNLEAGLFSGVEVNLGNTETLMSGGVSFATPKRYGKKISSIHEFELEEDFDDDWIEWQPEIVLK